jgi:hypothetical protein
LRSFNNDYFESTTNGLPKRRSHPLKYELSDPFNPSATISYELPMKSDVRLRLYDTIVGKVVTLVDRKLDVGSHLIRFDGRRLSSGDFLYRLHAGTFAYAKEFMLVRQYEKVLHTDSFFTLIARGEQT